VASGYTNQFDTIDFFNKLFLLEWPAEFKVTVTE